MTDNFPKPNEINCAILVLGDLNRSPRMLNHCIAINDSILEVREISLIGYNGGDMRNDIASNPKIKSYYIPTKINQIVKKWPRYLFALAAIIKVLYQLFSLFYTLMTIPKPKFLILQNPPGIPSIIICSIACFFRRTKFIIDWHNYGYTILEVNKRPSFLCKIAYFYEKIMSKSSHLNFCVSQAMQRNLKEQFNINAICLPDRPVKGLFKFLNENEKKDLYQKYSDALGPLLEMDNQKKPIAMISSTSWTPDEDFDMLLNCMIQTESLFTDITQVKKVLFIITGRGPMKDEFMEKVKKAQLKVFDVRSIWLDSDDYPKLLSSVDIGISLHYSSSGIDLPMKVVDMFSACLPAAAVYYPTITELVKEEENGYLFKDTGGLVNIFKSIIEEFSANGHVQKIDEYRKNLQKSLNDNDWVTQWKNRVQPDLVQLLSLSCDSTKH